MKISDYFKLGKTQFELDFVDIYVERDIPLFLDPNFIHKGEDRWCQEASSTVNNFFQTVVNLIIANETEEARAIFQHLNEPRETHLGLAQPGNSGVGVTSTNADEIFNNILESRAIETGLVEDLEDCRIFVKNFDKDRLSDLTTNIIRKQLVEYTISQCKAHGIGLTSDVASGFFWNKMEAGWEQSFSEALIIQDKKILLVPKRIVSHSRRYTSEQFYNHFVLNFLQEEQLKTFGQFVQKRKKTKEEFVTKKDVKTAQRGDKLSLVAFARQHPEVFRKFKEEVSAEPEYPLQGNEINEEVEPVDLSALCLHLADRLKKIDSGNDFATEYHKVVTSILAVLLYPTLFAPNIEFKIHEGRKRIDICFDNSAKRGVFAELALHPQTPCPYVFAECKNYSSDVANNELDQLAGRFSPTRSKVGLLVCRNISKPDLFIKRCKDTYTDQRGLIIPIVDQDLIEALEGFSRKEYDLLEKKIREIKRIVQT